MFEPLLGPNGLIDTISSTNSFDVNVAIDPEMITMFEELVTGNEKVRSTPPGLWLPICVEKQSTVLEEN